MSRFFRFVLGGTKLFCWVLRAFGLLKAGFAFSVFGAFRASSVLKGFRGVF